MPQGEQSGLWGLGRRVSSGGQTPGGPVCPRRGGLVGAERAVSGRAQPRPTGLAREDRAQTGLLLGHPGPLPQGSEPPLPRHCRQPADSC